MSNRKKLLRDQRTPLASVIMAIVAVMSTINPKFITVRSLITIFQQTSMTGILTMAMSMLLIDGDVDLSVGDIIVLSGIIMAQIINASRNIPLTVATGIGVAAAYGVLGGFVIAKSKCILLIITLGISQVLHGLALTISRGRIMGFRGTFNVIGKTKLFNVFPVVLFVLAAMVMLSYFFMNETKFGRRIVVIGGSGKNTFLSGINVTRYKIIIYAVAGFSCTIAAMIFSARIDSITANVGTGYETSTLTAAITSGVTFDGGKRTVSGTSLGYVLMGVISNAMNILQVEIYIQTIITEAIIVCMVVLDNINNVRKEQEVGQW